MPASSPGPAVGAVAVWTSCDLSGLGDQVLGRIVEAELLARLPGWRTAIFAPLGWDRPSPADGGLLAEPLGVHSPTRIGRLAASATLSVVCPGFPVGLDAAELMRRYGDDRVGGAEPFFSAGLGAEPESSHPVLLTGVRIAHEVPPALAALAGRAPAIAVRDAVSRTRLRDAGVERDITVVPHPGLLLRRAFDLETLQSRAQQLRQLGFLPEDGEYVVVALAEPGALPTELAGDDAVVVLPVGGVELAADDRIALPADLAVEDRLAVLAAARAVIATDEHVAAVAAGLGARWVLVDPKAEDRPVVLEFGDAHQIVDSFDEVPSALRAADQRPPCKDGAAVAVEAALDRVAELAEQALRARDDDPARRSATLLLENNALRAANQRQRERVRVERQRLTDAFASAVMERHAAVEELERIRPEHAELVARLAECERELRAWENTKLVRWSKPLRQAYGRARGR